VLPPRFKECLTFSLLTLPLSLALAADPTVGGSSTETPSTSTPAESTPALGGLAISTGTVMPGLTPTAQETHAAKASKIVKIKTEGNRNVRERVILAEVKTKKGDTYSPEALRKDVQSIFALGHFDDVTVELTDVPEGVNVTFKVIEKPMIKRIDFKGNKKLSASKLRDALSLKENDSLDRQKLNTDVDKLVNLYKDEGFAAAQVEPFTTSDPTNHVTITFYITEGTRVLIDSVNLEGVKAFKVKKVRKLMKTRRKKVFKQETLTKDLEEITRYYKNRGYMNVKIGEPTQAFNADKTRLTLQIPIEEGPLFHFGGVKFAGNEIFPSEKLAPAMVFKAGDIFNQERLDQSVAKLQDIYGAQGYIRVQIKPDFKQDLERGIVDIEFQMDEGEVVYVDHIAVEGNTHTKEFVIRREIQLKEGEPFSSVKARRSVEKLYNLGFLDNVDVDVQQPTSPTKADVIYTVTEGKPGMLSAGAGFSSVDGLIGTLQVQHTNFLGRAQRVNVQWQFGGRVNSFDIGWTDPWFMGRQLTFGVDIFRTNRVQQLGTNLDAYKTRNTGFSLTAGPRFSDIYNLLFTYSYSNLVRDDLDANLSQSDRELILGPAAATDPTITSFHAIKSNLTEQLIRDTRDNQFDPKRGMRTSLAVTEGGLGPHTIEFVKPVLDHSIHFPTFWKFVLSIHGMWGWVEPYGDSGLTDIVDDLFRVGGSDTIRGYELGQVGVPTGGQVANVYNVEYKFPIAPDEHGRTLLQGVFFYDIGGSWTSMKNVTYKIGDDQFSLKQGVGFGIRFKTPVFPLRLDWGYALNRAPNEEPSQFYFTVGSLF
jgi:outer membrane protein insertion porin family